MAAQRPGGGPEPDELRFARRHPCGGEVKPARPPRSVVCVSRAHLRITALVSLGAFTLLAVAVWRGHQPFQFEWRAVHFERHTFNAFGPSASLNGSSNLPDVLATPAIIGVFLISVVYGAIRRVLLRVAVYAGLAAAAFFIGEQIMKPLVQERYFDELSFPSGNVTAVCATAFAMWLALYPVLGRWARITTFVLGAAWTVLMSLAVVGALWHTPLDVVGSVLLSVGVVTAGGSFFERKAKPPVVVPGERERKPALNQA